MQKCFNAKIIVDNEYRILVINNYVSYIITQAIQFIVDKKIILLCFSTHIIHILQLLNINVFNFLTTMYSNNLHANTRFKINFAIDKYDFLKIFKLAYKKSIIVTNIQKI